MRILIALTGHEIDDDIAATVAQMFDSERDQIVAVEVGFVAFDTYDDFIGWTSASSNDPGNPKPGEQVVSSSAPDDLSSFYTGVAYVSRVRLGNGTVWEADLDHVVTALQQLDPSVTLNQIQE